jgi:V/A-type H+-transporting ATPase subunit G/H
MERDCGMADDKSLLKQIREKELEMSVKVDQARNEADHTLEQAKKESLALITTSEAEGKKAANEFFLTELEHIRAEADRVQAAANEEVKVVREKGEKNVPQAVEKIVTIVLSG